MDKLVAREVVVASLDALEIGWRAVSGSVLEADVPRGIADRYFDQRKRLRLVFDPEVWAVDRDADLVAPGSAVLRGLEQALVDRGVGSTHRYGGELWVDRRVLDAWHAEFRILNATEESQGHELSWRTAVRIVYEVRLPTPSVELVPVVYDFDARRVLRPPEVHQLHDGDWFVARELERVVPSLPDTPPQSRLKIARMACERRMRELIGPWVADHASAQEQQRRSQERRYREEAQARLQELDSYHPDSERQAERIWQELQQRLTHLEQRRGELEVKERIVQFLSRASGELRLGYRPSDGRALVVVSVPARLGRPRADLCVHCNEPRNDYFVRPEEPTRLVCSTCARQCNEVGCSVALPLDEPSLCSFCEAPSACAEHVATCSACRASICGQHRAPVACCDALLCPTHQLSPARDGRRLCSEHSKRCSVDGRRTHVDDLVQCAVTGLELFHENVARVVDDDRPLHPRAVVRCATTEASVARDRAFVCPVDDAWHRTDAGRKTTSGELVCSAHAVAVDLPEGVVVRYDRLAICTHTGKMLAREVAASCAWSGETYWKKLLVGCAECGALVFPAEANTARCGAVLCKEHGPERSPNGEWLCPRHRARCVVDGQWYPVEETVLSEISGDHVHRDHAVLTDEEPPRWAASTEVFSCSTTGRRLGRDRVGTCGVDGLAHDLELLELVFVLDELRCPMHRTRGDGGLWLASERLRRCTATGERLDVSLTAKSSVSGHVFRSDLLIRCPLTDKLLHPAEAVRARGDDRRLHPEALVRCSVSGELVARDKVVPDGLADNQPLHPDHAAWCAVSKRWTAKRNVVLVDCCDRPVAQQFAATSPVSGRTCCPDHGVLCVAHEELVMPDEARRCEVTGRKLCTQHVVRTDCGKTIDREQGIGLPSGRWECREHYGLCEVPGGWHPRPNTDLGPCVVCGRVLCAEHGANDPYQPEAPVCREHLKACSRCGVVTFHEREGRVCDMCTQVREIGGLTLEKQVYDRLVWPRLPLTARAFPTVLVSGTDHLMVFAVRSLLDQVRIRVWRPIQGDEVHGERIDRFANGAWGEIR